MVITGIEPRRKGLSELYIDGESALKLDTFILESQYIRVGMEITDEELFALIKLSQNRRASEKALYLLERRSHSKKELVDKISRTEDKEAALAAADRMEEIGLVDDEDFARRYAEELFARKRFGINRVKQELYRKGIDRDVIDAILEEQEFDSGENIRNILERKYPRYAEDEKIKQRAFAALQRMGYSYSEIRDALRFDEEY